ncbi:MAG: radical SAM protein [bacterium]
MSDKSDDFTFHRYAHSGSIDLKENTGLYIHIPFCTHVCPYCPYIKIPYRASLAEDYKKALLKEIRLYHDRFGNKTFSSLYIGGGTPALLINELDEVLEYLHRYFNLKGDLAIETNPADIQKPVAKRIKSMGFNLVSLGIQSFNDRDLKKIGRDYSSVRAVESLDTVMDCGFDNVNVDLIFAIENQSLDDIRCDLSTAVAHHAHQITCYPLFTFPHSEIGELKKLTRMRLPGIHNRRRMYYFITRFLQDHAFERTNVWSFSKNHSRQFSSVTRDYYLGLGAASGSYNGDLFYFNTFSIPEYMKTVDHGLPISIRMNVSKKMQKVFWLYWQFYKTTISKKLFRELFQVDFEQEFGLISNFIRMMGFTESEDPDVIRLNTRGSHWLHLIQNYYALNYVNKVWSVSRKNSWPDCIKL